MNRKTRRMAQVPSAEFISRPWGGSFARSMGAGLLSVLGLACSPALAQPVQPQPAATQSTAPALAYRSAFARYKPYAEQSVSGWREVNDEVGRIGGWRVYAREARQPVATEPTRASNDNAGRPGSKP